MSEPLPLLNAIVLAGGKTSAEFEQETGVKNRALAELAPGKTMLDFILDALNGARLVGRVVVVGDVLESLRPNNEVPEEELSARRPLSSSGPSAPTIGNRKDKSDGRNGKVAFVQPGATLIDNLMIGFEALGAGGRDRVLLVSADIPFISPSEVDDYAAQAFASGGDMCYPIVPMTEYNKRFASMKRTTLKIREGEFTGGNIMLMRAGVITDNPSAIYRAYQSRKSVPKLGAMLGWGFLARVLFSQIVLPSLLTIPMLETAIGNALGKGVVGKAIVTPHASIGTDVDKPEDVRIARQMLARVG